MPAKLTKVNETLMLDLAGCKGSEFSDALAKVREIPGRRWNPDNKKWELPAEPGLAERVIHSIQPVVDDELRQWVKEGRISEQQALTTPLPDDAELLVPWATKRAEWQPEVLTLGDEDVPFSGLLQHQRPMVDLAAHQRKLIIADDVGLGKTGSMISAVAEGVLRCANGEQSALRVHEEVEGTEQGEAPRTESPIGQEGPGADGREATSGVEKVHEEALRSDLERETEPVRGLRDQPTAGVHGTGPRSRDEALLVRPLAGGETQERRDPRAGDLGGNRQVRSAVSELSPREALQRGPKLIICPASVKGSWERELRMWLGDDVPLTTLDGTSAQRSKQLSYGIENNHWIIANWEMVRAKRVKKEIKRRNGTISKKTVEEMAHPLFEKTEWLAVIADEVHRAKNRKAQVSRGLWRVRGEFMFAASGTPLLNSPDELWSILHWLWPDEYTSYWRFYEQYVEYTEGYFGKTITGVKNPDALRFELAKKLARRTQGQVLDLPGRVRIPVPVTLNPKQRKLYKEAERQMWLDIEQAVKDGDKSAERFVQEAAAGAPGSKLLRLPNGAARTVRLRQIMESPALLGAEDDSAVLDAAVDKILDSGDKQWVVFSEFAETPSLLNARLRKRGIECAEYTGSVDPKDRTALAEKFQAGEIQVLAGTLSSMFQGITLTAAHHVCFLSRAWVPAINEQAEGRCDRISQTERVFVYILLPDDTVATSKVEPLNRIKEKIVSSVMQKDDIDHA